MSINAKLKQIIPLILYIMFQFPTNIIHEWQEHIVIHDSSPEVFCLMDWRNESKTKFWRQNKTHCRMLNTLQFDWFANEKSERWNGSSGAECVIVYWRFIIWWCEINNIIIQLDFMKKIWVIVWSQMAN